MAKLLKLNLQLFAEGGEGSEAAETNEDNTGSSDEWLDSIYAELDAENEKNKDAAKDEEKEEDEINIPKNRFDKVNGKYKELKATHSELETTHSELAEKHKTTTLELRDLQTTLKAHTERVTSLEGLISNMVDSKLKTIDESLHELIPANLNVEQKLDWLTKAEEKGLFNKETKSENTFFNLGSQTNKPSTPQKHVSAIEKILVGYGRR